MMSRSYTLLSRVVFLSIGFLFAFLFISCTDKPEAKWDNPVDPENPDTHGDPYQLVLQIANGGVHLSWNPLESLPVDRFHIYRKVNDDDDFSLLDEVDGENSYTDTQAENGKRYEYYVASVNSQGEEANISNVVSISINTYPVIIIAGEDVEFTPTREVSLTILAFGAEKMRVSNLEDLNDSEWSDYQNLLEWELTEGDGTKSVYLQVIYANGDTSEVMNDTIEPSPINASMLINDDAEMTTTREVTLTLEATGVDSVFISNEDMIFIDVLPEFPGDHIDLDALDELGEWYPMTQYIDWSLSTGEGDKSVSVLFMNDFGMTQEVTDTIEPTPLNLSIEVENGAEYTGNRTVNLKIEAVGGYEMEISNENSIATGKFPAMSSATVSRQASNQKISNVSSNSINSIGLLSSSTLSKTELDEESEWIPFEDELDWDLSTGPGQKTVTVKVRNDFLIEEQAVDNIMPQLPTDYGFEILTPDTTTRYDITIAFQGTNVDSILIATEDDLEDGVWIAFADTIVWNLQGFIQPPDNGLFNRNSIDNKSSIGKHHLNELDAIHYNLYFQFKNSFEVLSEVLSGEIIVDISSMVEISRGNDITDSRFVSLTLFSIDANEMAIDTSLANLENNPNWRPYYINLDNFALTYGPGTKTVYAKFRNESGAESEVVSDEIEPINLDASFTINNGQDSTSARVIALQPQGQGRSLQWIFSENEDFSDAQWHDLNATENCTLSVVQGETETSQRTVYVQIKNDFEIVSPVLSQTVQTDSIYGNVDLVSDYQWTNISEVQINMYNVRAMEMKLGTDPDSANLDWQVFRPTVQNFPLSDGDGIKHVYAWFKNDFYTEGPFVDSTGLDTQVNIESFSWTGTAQDTVREGEQLTFTMNMTADGFGPEINGQAMVTVPGMLHEYPLNDNGDGTYSVTITVSDDMQAVRDAEVIGSFIDRAGNQAENVTAEGTITYWVDPGTVNNFALGNTGLEIPMVWIAPGSFQMGAYAGEQEARNEEYPQHQVSIEDGFWIGIYEITQAQWTAVTGYNPAFFSGNPDNPVEQISWTDVQEDFLSVLNETDPDDAWRLPSEAEWEFAARAGTTTRYYWGDDPDSTMIDDYAWYFHNSNEATQLVGQKLPNPWGLYDVQGNVNEWCQDYYHDSYDGAPGDANPWLNPPANTRVSRGGNWNSRPRYSRSASRYDFIENYQGHFVGMRVVRSAP